MWNTRIYDPSMSQSYVMSSTTSQVSGAETQSPCHTACWEALVEPLLSLRNLINLERFQKEHHSTLQNHPFSMVSLEIFRKIPPSPHPPSLPRATWPKASDGSDRNTSRPPKPTAAPERCPDVHSSRGDHWMVTICGKPWGTTLWL